MTVRILLLARLKLFLVGSQKFFIRVATHNRPTVSHFRPKMSENDRKFDRPKPKLHVNYFEINTIMEI